VTASEFAFLAIGLVLGVAAGAALVEVARSRPAARPEVRVTVAPNSIRSRATTLAEERPDGGRAAPARGGPADRRWVDREDEGDDDPPAGPPVSGSGSSSGRPGPPTASTDPDWPGPPNRTPVPFVLQPPAAGPSTSFPFPPLVAGGPSGGSGRAPVGITITREPDPMMAALRSSAASQASVREADGSVGAGNVGPSASGSTAGGATMTLAASPVVATRHEAAHEGGAAPAGEPAPEALAKRNGRGPKTAIAAGAASADGPAAAQDLGPCADQRRVADERCAVATRARDGARRAAEVLRQAQRDYDDHVGRAENAAASADPRSVRTAKESAQQAFRAARSAATSRDEIETAARDWLTEINQINHVTREAFTQAERHRAAALEVAPNLEPLALEADAARISAESAEEACVAAREAVATCEESEAAAAAAAAEHSGIQAIEVDEQAKPDTGIAAAAQSDLDSSEFDVEESMGSRAGEDAAIIRLLRGDREVLPRIVARLGGNDPDEQRRWRVLLSGLVEALVARSIEAASFDFPTNHPFWGPFSRAQCRDIAAALASLGYRHDGFGGWADERVPSQRDLSLAVGYAGLDPMRIRQWPTESEMRELLRDVTVAADEYVWSAAGALTLGELVSLLGRRADGLTDLWNDWGAVRPLLLAVG
jgi:hypothetical protein